jgi:hypothetical protein
MTLIFMYRKRNSQSCVNINFQNKINGQIVVYLYIKRGENRGRKIRFKPIINSLTQ